MLNMLFPILFLFSIKFPHCVLIFLLRLYCAHAPTHVKTQQQCSIVSVSDTMMMIFSQQQHINVCIKFIKTSYSCVKDYPHCAQYDISNYF